MISARLATLHELDTVYGGTDLYKLVEVVRIDAFNQKISNKWATREGR